MQQGELQASLPQLRHDSLPQFLDASLYLPYVSSHEHQLLKITLLQEVAASGKSCKNTNPLHFPTSAGDDCYCSRRKHVQVQQPQFSATQLNIFCHWEAGVKLMGTEMG